MIIVKDENLCDEPMYPKKKTSVYYYTKLLWGKYHERTEKTAFFNFKLVEPKKRLVVIL